MTLAEITAAKARHEQAVAAAAQAYKEYVQAIRQARESHSLAEIAQELGVSRQRIHQISEEK
jgi:biotin operon repressor